MENTKTAHLFRITRIGSIQMGQAITDLRRLAICWGALMIIQATALACYFLFNDHLELFLAFLAILVTSIALTGWAYYALPYSVDDALEPIEEAERIGQRTSNSWAPRE